VSSQLAPKTPVFTIHAPINTDVSITPTSEFLEAWRVGSFLNPWDMSFAGWQWFERWFGITYSGKGVEVRMGTVTLNANI